MTATVVTLCSEQLYNVCFISATDKIEYLKSKRLTGLDQAAQQLCLVHYP